MTPDPRVTRTRARLRAALLDCCAQRPLDQLGVADVVRAAGIARATFYLHYDDLRALAIDACGELVRTTVDALHAMDRLPDAANPPTALTELFTAVSANAGLYQALLGPSGGGPLGELLHAELMARSLLERRRRLPDGHAHEAASSAVASAFTGLVADWAHDRIPGSPDTVAAQAWRVFWAIHAAFSQGRSSG
ncbi:MAG: TetR/AcrR family transcriptional regulator [Actinomycetota bacterium]|nr:TetR/AcrR family transcriptional regulator [Actinomycetota bacterium]